MTAPACEACGGEQPLPPETQSEKTAGEQATPSAEASIESSAALGVEGETVTPEAYALQAPPPLEPAPELPPAGLPWLRWVEIALATTAILLAGLTIWARAKSQ
jgi:hypothetical protein